MKKIDHETVQRILDAADIVEVVSDFVSLKRRGANYIGLCPFHNERTPSFSVSKSKGICKCFSCGKGGSAVNFIMEHEQLSFQEALRYLARKYNIEIREQEMTQEEIEQQSERENMLAVNDFAMRHFEKNLTDTQDGRDIGLSYFRYRGIDDKMIEKFHLGYALEASDNLYNEAVRRGYSEKYLMETGLCARTERGRVYDRFRGRVIYPVFTLSGKVVAFGGRTLKTDKSVAKYVNSPESIIYSKRRELYGMYQAKQAIVKVDKCILVEGYMDVISMHQAGVCNVVASSGTSLTQEQIRLIHRFTSNVTVIYDSDAAGIKASLRGIDMLLAEGLNIKVLSLPDGDDPDSFAQSHSSTEVEEYIRAHETDFIRFKTRILLEGVENDPIKRSQVITDIVKSISVIPDEITRNVYIQECSRMMEMDEKVLQREVAKHFAEYVKKQKEQQQREREISNLPPDQRQAARDMDEQQRLADEAAADAEAAAQVAQPSAAQTEVHPADRSNAKFLRPYELGVLKFALKYGMQFFCDLVDGEGNTTPVTVIDYINNDLTADDISFSNPDVARVFNEALRLSRADWEGDLARHLEVLQQKRAEEYAAGVEEIRKSASDLGSINAMEKALQETVDNNYQNGITEYSAGYLAHIMCSSPDEEVRRITTELVIEKYTISRIHTKYARIETEQDRLMDLVPRKIFELKDAILWTRLTDLRKHLAAVGSSDYDTVIGLMRQIQEIEATRKELAKYLGDRVIAPRK